MGLLDRLFGTSDPSEASPKRVASKCAIELSRVPVDTVPLQYYREYGEVRCERCQRRTEGIPRPVGCFQFGRLCHECLAERLGREYHLLEDEAIVVALAAFGWEPEEIDRHQDVPRRSDEAHEVLARVQDFGLYPKESSGKSSREGGGTGSSDNSGRDNTPGGPGDPW